MHTGDSSDEEILLPRQISAFTKALLERSHHPTKIPSPPSIPAAAPAGSISHQRRYSRADNQELPLSRIPSPVNTPAPPVRTVKIAIGSSSQKPSSSAVTTRASSKRSTGYGNQELPDHPSSSSRPTAAAPLSRTRSTRFTSQDNQELPDQPSSGTRLSAAAPLSRTRSTRFTSQGNQELPDQPSSGTRLSAAALLSRTRSTRFTGQDNQEVPDQPSSATRPSTAAATSHTRPNRFTGHGNQELPDQPSSGNRPSAVAPSRTRSNRFAGLHNQELPDHHINSNGPPAAAPQGSMRLKRAAKTPGSFLSGPARRGLRRQSEEDAAARSEGSPISIKEQVRAHQQDHEDKENKKPPTEHKALALSNRGLQAEEFASVEIDISKAIARARAGTDAIRKAAPSPPPKTSVRHIAPPSPPKEPVQVAPPSQSKASIQHIAAPSPKSAVQVIAPVQHVAPPSPPKASIQDMALPPPPKMTVVDTATTPAGASAAGQPNKKKQILLRVNGRAYAKIDCIGRGGSGRVYRVSAESGKMLALKRVPLELLDERAIQSFKGEIELLKRLHGVDRVIQLIDHELNLDKKMLSMVMEIGELDFHTFLSGRRGDRMDPVFIRHWWKEMVECLRAVHAKDIVHSDLKPANFVIVQGRLKIIDFGIANAIQTDMTVNVHRDIQIGTPNYMAPEALMDACVYDLLSANNGHCDSLAISRAQEHIKTGRRLMKVGKASDVWSLGCMLYQMVYGVPPFFKFKTQFDRVQAIINWAHQIDFPDKTHDGVRVPPSLIRTMIRCLNREQKDRPTCDELLAETDPFLYPQEFPSGEEFVPLTQDYLGRLLLRVVQKCRSHIPSDDEVMQVWAKGYYEGLKRAMK
ncbi:Serine/threonine-protein kinase MPS1 [Madurella mycetomatis]|uniref:Serine/threonine-protein kinase MPS1 n=1 Tax=Madurella mycetomatis TaxID=100816 RepID=A0A175W0T3_9PEZI|nr:Serine/threonine-protein kinase MPS1 [Madurella mycetomatis]